MLGGPSLALDIPPSAPAQAVRADGPNRALRACPPAPLIAGNRQQASEYVQYVVAIATVCVRALPPPPFNVASDGKSLIP